MIPKRTLQGSRLFNIDNMFGNGDGLMQEAEIDAFETYQSANSPAVFCDDNGTPFADTTCFLSIAPYCLNLDLGAGLTQNLVR